MPAFLARFCSSALLLPSTSTPPWVLPSPRRLAAPDFFDRSSEGPVRSFGSQWSPFFSATFFTDPHAVRCARCSSPYSCCALSRVFSYVRWTLAGERSSVLGRSSFLLGMGPPHSPFFVEVPGVPGPKTTGPFGPLTAQLTRT